jgi:hypothetical protein
MALRRAVRHSGRARTAATTSVVLLALAPALSACAADTRPVSAEASPSLPSGGVSPSVPAVDPPPADGGAATEAPAPSPSEKPRAVQGGGFASAVPGSDAPNRKVDVGPQFQVRHGVDIAEIERLVTAVERIAKQQAAVDAPMATGGSLAEAVGTFSYRWFADGTVQPDPAWVSAHIRTQHVPILGQVTGHRVLFPQLRGALREVVARGLAAEIHPEEFGGIYVPRFIGRDPSQGLSLHTWGIAIDLNVPGNQRGVAGEIDREVVAIFKKWGFAWGGDWAWTDPMHFEMNRLVRAAR